MKKKILVLSDHALSTSGVGTQTRHLLNGLLEKFPGKYTFRQLGAALKHDNYSTIVVNEDLIIKPVDGFGTQELLRKILLTEKPDALLIFTDPRFFTWLFEIEDEIHQVCPILWWHVWDNYPYPAFNAPYYEATDALNCHSHMTYEMLKNTKFGNKTKFIPHAIPKDMFFPLKEEEILAYKRTLLGENLEDAFVAIWVNRNAKRKRPNDVLLSWKIFMENNLNRKAVLIMHTEPHDTEGPNLIETAQALGIRDSVFFSKERIEFEKMNVLYNIADVCMNISYAEGFGLGTLEAMMSGTPIIAPKTGGLTRQVVNHITGEENGVALDVQMKTLVGSQTVPYIFEDYVSCDYVASALLKISLLSGEEKKALSQKVLEYARQEFSYNKTIDDWDASLTETISQFNNKKLWEISSL